MGEKYDNYANAAKAEQQAKNHLAAASGGSTKETMDKAVNNAKSAEVVSNVLFNEFLNDPEG